MKIILVCSAGMSTSLLVSKMRQAAEEKSESFHIEAVSASNLEEYLKGTDVILIGPQVRYMKTQIEKQSEPHGIKVDVINQMDYGMVNGSKVLEHAVRIKE